MSGSSRCPLPMPQLVQLCQLPTRTYTSILLNFMQMALIWWLGLDKFQNSSSCSFCPSLALDPLGHHALTCKSGGDSIFRHHSLRDAFWESCKLACIAGQIEAGSGLDVEGSRTRPADILLPNWEFSKPHWISPSHQR